MTSSPNIITPSFFSRPFLSLDTSNMVITTNTLPPELTPSLLLEDVLYVLTGINGSYIYQDSISGLSSAFKVSDQVTGSVRVAVERVVKVADDFVVLSAWVETVRGWEQGRVVHAFAEAVEGLLDDYLVVVSQLEKLLLDGELSIQKVGYYVKPSADCFSLLRVLISEIMETGVTGGKLINVIKNRAVRLSGFGKSKELFFYLLEQSFVPYGVIMRKWLTQGTIDDPFGEFFISSNGEERVEYRIIEDMIPYVLEEPQKILEAGKYLTILKRCGIHDFPFVDEILFKEDARHYKKIINAVYEYSTENLFTILVEKYNIHAQLELMKNAMLLQSSDFLNYFFSNSTETLDFSVTELDNFNIRVNTEAAIQQSSLKSNPFRENLIGGILNYTIQNHIDSALTGSELVEKKSLHGLEAYYLDYHLGWPLNLFIDESVMEKYRILFRVLFRLHYSEMTTAKIWGSRFAFPSDHIFALRQKLNHFISCLKVYLHTIVIPQHWKEFSNAVQGMTNLDQLKEAHETFINNCLRDSLITDKQVLKLLQNLFTTCRKVYQILQVIKAERELFTWIKSTQEKFDSMIKELINQLSSDETLTTTKFTFCNLLNRNEYYS